MDKKLVCYELGQVCDMKMDGDGAIFEVFDNQCRLNIAMSNLSKEEIEILSAGKIEVYLGIIEGIIFISVTLGEDFVFNIPFNAGLYDKFTLEDPSPYGFVVPIFIVENTDNTIQGMRVMGFDAEFSKKFYEASREQFEHKIPNYKERVVSVFERYSPKDIIRNSILKNKMRRINL